MVRSFEASRRYMNYILSLLIEFCVEQQVLYKSPRRSVPRNLSRANRISGGIIITALLLLKRNFRVPGCVRLKARKIALRGSKSSYVYLNLLV